PGRLARVAVHSLQQVHAHDLPRHALRPGVPGGPARPVHSPFGIGPLSDRPDGIYEREHRKFFCIKYGLSFLALRRLGVPVSKVKAVILAALVGGIVALASGPASMAATARERGPGPQRWTAPQRWSAADDW